jgi:hypothetical protein
MNEAQKFLQKNDVKYDGKPMLAAKDAITFLGILQISEIPFYGFDGFKNRPDISTTAVQIHSSHSRDYSSLDIEDAYKAGILFFKEHEHEADFVYEMVFLSSLS